VIDAANWESLEQGREQFLEGGILSREELDARQNLPDFIRKFLDEKERGIRRTHIHDRLWELCYRALLAQAEEEGCRYLIDYVPWEIELRNRLVALRLRESGGNVDDHAVLPGIRSADFTAMLSQLESQKNPLAAERYLDGERLKQIFHCQGHDPFSLDALLAFLSRAMIYGRWEMLQAPYDMNNFLYGGG
jgi:vacuolar-type H+-ATPase subunit C/Vma6